MKRLLFIFILLASPSFLASAQIKDGHNYAFGVGYAYHDVYSSGIRSDKGYGPAAFFEYREVMFPNFDLGVQVNFRYAKGMTDVNDEGTILNLNGKQFGLKVVGDYIFCPDKRANPYLGLCIGLGSMFLKRVDNVNYSCLYETLGLRAGVQVSPVRFSLDTDLCFWNRFRSRSTINRRGNVLGSSLALTVGFVF